MGLFLLKSIVCRGFILFKVFLDRFAEKEDDDLYGLPNISQETLHIGEPFKCCADEDTDGEEEKVFCHKNHMTFHKQVYCKQDLAAEPWGSEYKVQRGYYVESFVHQEPVYHVVMEHTQRPRSIPQKSFVVIVVIVHVVTCEGVNEVDASWQYRDYYTLKIKQASVVVKQKEVPVRKSRRRVWKYARTILEDGLQHL